MPTTFEPISRERPFYTVAELADALGVTIYTIREWIKQDRFPGAINLSGQTGYRIPAEDLNRFSARVAAKALLKEAAARTYPEIDEG
jgi:excisionase family DNA binding protein